ncbi:MAG TPA: hypothetical protein VHH88_07295, partial [Verrucomicrobiae bacterium]|nr:hypothetical protein [Verrucomicrobiae bacterium]
MEHVEANPAGEDHIRSKISGPAEASVNRRVWLTLLAALGALAMIAAGWRAANASPRIPLLPSLPHGQWIIYPTPASGHANLDVELSTRFHRSFLLTNPIPTSATLSIAGFRKWRINLNGQEFSRPGGKQDWKKPSLLQVARFLHAGTNELAATVSCDSGLPALWLSLQAGPQEINSDAGWECSLAGATREKAQRASTALPIRPGGDLYADEAPARSLALQWPVLAGYAAICLIGLFAFPRFGRLARERAARLPFGTKPETLLTLTFVVAWVCLWANNFAFIPMTNGFDAQAHLKYIEYILAHHSLPFADQGFQMYQPPLYYLMGAVLMAICHLSPLDASGVYVLRLLGLACGIAVFIFALLSLRLLYPESRIKQLLGLSFAALTPFAIYLSFYPTNEMLAMAVMAAAIYLLLRIITEPAVSLAQHALFGVVCGLALLAKASAIVLLPIAAVALPWNLWQREKRSLQAWLIYGALTAGTCLVVCGWHYFRVAHKFGNPFATNLDANVGYTFWQQPGFRAPGWYLPKGQVFRHPFFSGFSSFWDGLYSTMWGDGLWGGQVEAATRPPWNYQLMAAGYILALVPTACILAGFCRLLYGFARRPRPEAFVLLALFFLCSLLVFTLSLKAPAYSLCKAFYASGAVVSLCIFAAIGADAAARKFGRLKLALWILLSLWAVNTYMTFWIHHDAHE